MEHRLLIDNWTLQNAGELIAYGLNGESANDLVFSKDGSKYKYEEISADLVRFEALCQLLNVIVFADELYVDKEFASTWEQFGSILAARDSKIIIKKPFKALAEEWIPAREAIADRLCANASLLKAHRANKRWYAKNGESKDALLSQLVWGGAGMLARAEYFKLPYLPHPARARLFSRAGIVLGSISANVKLTEFVLSERIKVYQRYARTGMIAEVHLDPVVIEIIEASSNMESLVKSALHLRDEYKHVRKWIAELHEALAEDSPMKVLNLTKALESVSHHIDSHGRIASRGDTTFQLGFNWLKFTFKGSPWNSIRNRFGVRAELSRLILMPGGYNCVKKLIRMLGEQHTKRGQSLIDVILRRHSPK